MLSAEEVQNYGLWLQSGAIVVSFVGVIVMITWMRLIARRRATLDLVLAEESIPELIEQRTVFGQLRDAGHLAQWADPAKTTTQEAAVIRAILNRYEIIAIGIQKGTLDEKIYKKWCRTTLVKEWVACKPFVMQLRQNAQTPAYFCEVEKLARHWADNSERQHV